MFSLYLQGYSCEEIHRLNQGFTLGMIVQARVNLDWDKQKYEHSQSLMAVAQEKVRRAQLESISFASDGMAVFHKMLGDKFKKYIQNGKLDELGEFKNSNFRTYKELTDLLMKLTNQVTKKEKNEADEGEVEKDVTPSEENHLSVTTTALALPDDLAELDDRPQVNRIVSNKDELIGKTAAELLALLENDSGEENNG